MAETIQTAAELYREGTGNWVPLGGGLVLYKAGLMKSAFYAPLSARLQYKCYAMGFSFYSFETADLNGLGTLRALEAVEFGQLVKKTAEEIKNKKGKGVLFLVGHSIGSWILLAAALEPEVLELIAGMVLLAPAMDCLTLEYNSKLKELQEGGEKEQAIAKRLEEDEEVMRLGQGLPYSKQFKDSSKKYEMQNLDLGKLTFPISIIHGGLDKTVQRATVQKLVDSLPQASLITHPKLDHSFDGPEIFGEVQSQLQRLANQALPNLANDQEELQNKDEWLVTRNGHNQLVFLHLPTGTRKHNLEAANAHIAGINKVIQENMKMIQKDESVVVDPFFMKE